jgi:glycosyltransferase involved in cell wall biosynthesis
MSVGRPVIATGTGGSGEYLEDGVNCLLFPPGDGGALAHRVRRLANDPALRARLIENGRATAARYPQAAFEDAVIARALARASEGSARAAAPSR